MEHIGLLFKKNTEKSLDARFDTTRKHIEVRLYNTKIEGSTLDYLLKVFTGVIEQYGRVHPPIFIDFRNVEFADKLTYITLESILYCMIVEYRFDVILSISGENKITAPGWKNSPLIYLTNSEKEKRREFKKGFKFMLSKEHYRRVVVEKEDKSYLSQIYDDISCFMGFSGYDFDENFADEVAGVIAELISNAVEHGGKECLVDVDIAGGFTDKYDKGNPKKEYIGLGLSVVNFSDKCVGEDLKKKMTSDLKSSLPERYNVISKALVNHMREFDDNYLEEDFYNIAIFQNKISGRYNTSESGGTGMLRLIKALGDRSKGDNCYMLSGRRIVQFYNQFMVYDRSGWIGFNKENNFVGKRPAEEVIQVCPMFFPGVAYNLQFIMERGKK